MRGNSLLGDHYENDSSSSSTHFNDGAHRFNPPSSCARMFSTEQMYVTKRYYYISIITLSICAIIILSLSLDIAFKPREYFFGGGGGGDDSSSSSSGAPYVPSSSSSSSSSASSSSAAFTAGSSSSASMSSSSSGGASSSSTPLLSSSSSAPTASVNLSSSITTESIFETLQALQAIADTSFNTRAIGTLGFNRTVDYIYNQLSTRTSIFDLAQQSFQTSAWNLTSTPIVNYSPARSGRTVTWNRSSEYQIYTFSGSCVTDPTAGAPVKLITAPCAGSSWTPALSGSIVLIQKSTCGTNGIITNAVANGVIAVLFYNQPNIQGLGLIGGLPNKSTPIAVLSVANPPGEALAAELASGGAVTMILSITGLNFRTYVTNTCATTQFGNKSNIIISGSHCDSVPAGPGINDNGSGTSLNMALALALNRGISSGLMLPFANAVRFCWWAAEETGLEGSQYYVQQAVLLSGSTNPADYGNRIEDIAANLNYDIAGSPNGVFGVWDGDSFNPGRATNYTDRAVNGSLEITRAFEDYFNNSGLPYDYRELDSRSDYQSFHDAGVAAGGATSGRETIKTIEQRNRYASVIGPGYGGIPGIAFDPCYHQFCDQVSGINPFQVTNVAKSAAAVLEKLARNTNIQTLLYNTAAPDIGNLTMSASPYTSRVQRIQHYWSQPESMQALSERFAESQKRFFIAENGGMLP